MTAPGGGDGAQVTMWGDELEWRPVSPRLFQARALTVSVVALVAAVAGGVLSVTVSRWFLALVAAALIGWLWGLWLVRRQVSAITWIELDDEIVIRKGRLLRSLEAVPYGRLQYVEVESGPIDRLFGLAVCTIHTASPDGSGSLPGLPRDEAERLRARLSKRGESQRAGL